MFPNQFLTQMPGASTPLDGGDQFYPVSDDNELIHSSLVLVHGLGGHPRDTWTSDQNILSKALTSVLHKQPKLAVFWPADLLAPRIPNVRILVYGYDSSPAHIFDAVSRISVYQHSSNLLQDLASDEERVKDVST